MGLSVLIISYEHSSHGTQWILVDEIRLGREIFQRSETALQPEAASRQIAQS